jgi:hypothetical protein
MEVIIFFRSLSNLGHKYLACLLLIVLVFGCKKAAKEQTVELKEISAFDVPEQLRSDFSRGQTAQCSEQPDPNVTAYPDFISDKPLFGSMHLPRGIHEGLRGRWYYFAFDQTSAESQSYDTLYFDLNSDLDLTNDTPLTVQQNPPKRAILPAEWLKQQICFEFLYLPLPFGDEGNQTLEIMPRLAVDENGNKFLALVTTKAFTGKVNIEGRSYDVWLGHNRFISGWFNHPSTALHLVKDGDFQHRQYTVNLLMVWRKINGTDYHFSASPSGDQLMVMPYKGKYGTLKAKPVNTVIKRAKLNGGVYSGQTIYFFGGRRNKFGERKPISSCRIPVGDYTAGLEIYLDDLHISTAGNIHSDGQRSASIDDPRVLSIKIREYKPFILDFSAKPEVIFTSPANEQRLKSGEQIKVEAVLIDPKLDLMFTDIERAEFGFNPPDSDWNFLIFYSFFSGIGIAVIIWLFSLILHSKRRILLILAGLVVVITVSAASVYYIINLEYDFDDISPSVTIARSNGEIISRGPMPFG